MKNLKFVKNLQFKRKRDKNPNNSDTKSIKKNKGYRFGLLKNKNNNIHSTTLKPFSKYMLFTIKISIQIYNVEKILAKKLGNFCLSRLLKSRRNLYIVTHITMFILS